MARVESIGQGYKGYQRLQFAQASVAPHSRSSGLYRRVKILGILASSRLPLTAGEIVRRSGLPRRTVHYYLSRMLKEGLVERDGCPPLSYYIITRAGMRVYNSCRWVVQTGLAGVGVAGVGVGGVGRGGGGSRGSSRVVVRVGVVDNELRFRCGWGVFRRLLRGFGFNVRGVRFRHMYTRGGVVHYDSRHRVELAGLGEPVVDLPGLLGNFVFVASCLKAMVDAGVLHALVDAAPEAVFV